MGNFVIKSSQLTNAYEYVDDSVIVQGSYQTDTVSGNMTGINGQVYEKTVQGLGRYIGNFTGSPSGDGEMSYDLSSMTRSDRNKTWAAIDDIESHITGENGE